MALVFKPEPVTIPKNSGKQTIPVDVSFTVPTGAKINSAEVAIKGFNLDFTGPGDHNIDIVRVGTTSAKHTNDTVEFNVVVQYSDRGSPPKEYSGSVDVLIIADVGP